MKFFTKLMATCVLGIVLTGCQTPAVHVINTIINGGMQLDKNMREVNVTAMVDLDETWAGDYPFRVRNVLYPLGVISGTPEYGLRLAFIRMRHPAYGAWVSAGQKLWLTAAVIPDNMAPLKKGDVVEIRQTGTANVVKDFLSKEDGNIIIRMLCRAADPNYQACLEPLPRIGKYKGFGETNTYYPSTIKEYGLTFTPKYDKDGNPLR